MSKKIEWEVTIRGPSTTEEYTVVDTPQNILKRIRAYILKKKQNK